MRLSLFTVGILACSIASVAAWSKEDQEIFRLKEEVESSEGTGVSFYEFVGVKDYANLADINEAYKKKSRLIHPDKVKRQFIADKSTRKDTKKGKKPGVNVSKGPSQAKIRAIDKAASDRFARLGIVINILRGEDRDRYDHFLKNGFPKWKGTGYYYARFRPGLFSVLIGLFVVLGGAGHWVLLYTGWRRQQEFVDRYIKFARHAAWGETLNIPGLDGTSTPPAAAGNDIPRQPMNRKERRMQEKGDRKNNSEKNSRGIKAAKPSASATPPAGAVGPRKRVVAENGKNLVVDSVGNVYLEQQDEEGETHEFLLDLNEFPQPTMKNTALVRVPIWVFNRTVSRFLNKAEVEEEIEEGEEEGASSSSGADDFEVLEKVKTTAQNGNGYAVRRNKKSARGR